MNFGTPINRGLFSGTVTIRSLLVFLSAVTCVRLAVALVMGGRSPMTVDRRDVTAVSSLAYKHKCHPLFTAMTEPHTLRYRCLGLEKPRDPLLLLLLGGLTSILCLLTAALIAASHTCRTLHDPERSSFICLPSQTERLLDIRLACFRGRIALLGSTGANEHYYQPAPPKRSEGPRRKATT